MGHKEQLLAGAKACLIERGYANTTARDIVERSKTNLASIGYHYGSLDKLLTTAMIEMLGEWGERTAAAPAPSGRSSEARFRTGWANFLELFETDRSLMLASLEIAALAARSNDLTTIFQAAFVDVRNELPDDFLDLGKVDAKTKKAVGSALLALMSGVSVQKLIDPEGAPDADAIILGVKAIAKAMPR